MTKYRGFQNVWWLTLLTVIIIIGVSYLTILLPENFLGENGILCFSEFLFIIPCSLGILLMKKKYMTENERTANVLGFTKFKPMLIPLLLLLPMAAQYFATYMTIHFSLITIILFGTPESITTPQTSLGFVQMLVALCVLAPLFEEILCRGVMMKMLEKHGVATEILISALSFAMLHFSIQGFAALFFVGVLFGAVKKLTGSIFPCMLMHAVNNASSFAMTVLTEKGIISGSPIVLCALTLFIAFPFLLWGFIKSCENTKLSLVFKPIYKKGISIGLIICTATFIVFHAVLLTDRIQSGEFKDDISIFSGDTEIY